MTLMTTVNDAVRKATEVFVAVAGGGSAETVDREAQELFDAAWAVYKLLSPFVTSAEAEEDSGYDIEPDDL